MRLNFDWWTWLMTILVALFITMFMCGCHTTRYVPVETIVRDTTTFAHWDSIVNERVKVVRDSLLSYHWEQQEKSVKDSTYIKDDVRTRVDQDGKVVGKDSTHIEYRYIESAETKALKDSVNRLFEVESLLKTYKEQRDSLNKVLSETQYKVEYKEKDLEGMDLFYYRLGLVLFWVFILLIISGFVILFVKKSKFFHGFFSC